MDKSRECDCHPAGCRDEHLWRAEIDRIKADNDRLQSRIAELEGAFSEIMADGNCCETVYNTAEQALQTREGK